MKFWQSFLSLFMSAPTVTTTTLYTMASGKPCQRDHIGNVTKRVHYVGRFEIDGDGRGPAFHDPDDQKTTSYRKNGQSLDSSADDYGVGYLGFITEVPEDVLGCQGRLTHLPTGISFPLVCGDVGPHNGYGEGSESLAKKFEASGVKIDWSPTEGGDGALEWQWEWFPGQAAFVNDETFPLQPYEEGK